jgi:hypothetical protein
MIQYPSHIFIRIIGSISQTSLPISVSFCFQFLSYKVNFVNFLLFSLHYCQIFLFMSFVIHVINRASSFASTIYCMSLSFLSFIFFMNFVIHVINRVSEVASTIYCMSLNFLSYTLFMDSVIHVLNRVSEFASTIYCMSLNFLFFKLFILIYILSFLIFQSLIEDLIFVLVLRPDCIMQSLLLRVSNFIRIIPDEVFAHHSAKVSPHFVGEATIVEVFQLDFFLKPRKVCEFPDTHRSIQTAVNCCNSHGIDIHDLVEIDRSSNHDGSNIILSKAEKEFFHCWIRRLITF